MLKKIAALVQSQGHCVLATCAPGPDASGFEVTGPDAPGPAGRGRDASGPEGRGCAPHASLMSFCAAPDCAEFWLATRTDTRKYANLAANPVASLLLDDRAGAPGGEPGLALTVEVERASFAGAADEAAARRALLARHPRLAGFLDDPLVVVLRLKVLRFQLLTGLSEVFSVEAEKMLDGSGPRE